MIFVIDVGNTNMTMGVFQGKRLEATFRIMTKTPRTSDDYGIMITQLLKNNGIEVTDIEGAIIASVVPDVMHSLTSSIIRYLKTKPLIVGPGVKSGIKVATEDPRAIGADRIVTIRQGLDSGVDPGQLCRVFRHLPGDVRVAKRDLFQHRSRHTGKVLFHTADAGAALFVGDL